MEKEVADSGKDGVCTLVTSSAEANHCEAKTAEKSGCSTLPNPHLSDRPEEALFTSEIFKIELKNFPNNATVLMVKKRLEGLGLEPHKVKVMPEVAFITFKNEEQRQKALSVLPGHIWRGAVLTAKPAKPKADPFAKKAAGEPDSKRARPSEDNHQPLTIESALELLRSAVAPLAKLSYDDQLKQKSSNAVGLIKKLSHDIKQIGGFVGSGGYDPNETAPVLPIVASPVISHYRNKCQFTIAWCPIQTDKVVVGYRLGRYRHGDAEVYPPDSVPVAPEAILAVVHRLESLLNEPEMKIRAPPYNAQVHRGCCKAATVRCNSDGKTLLYLDIHAPFLARLADDNNELRDFIENRLRDRLLGVETGCVASLHAVYTDRSGGEAAGEWRHLGGDADITEQLGGLTFRVSPAAFFQVNTAAAAVLHERIRDLLLMPDDTIDAVNSASPDQASSSSGSSAALLDVCCGTGTIGLSLARYFSRIVGIELIPDAVSDARLNAARNGIENASFVVGRAEDAVPREAALLAELVDDVRVVLDPPRGGLQPSVLAAIRRCRVVRRLLYVSCSPQSARQNFLDLCRPASNKWRGEPFRLAVTQPVDLFPMTEHCELLLMFVRQLPTKIQESTNAMRM